ncbi:TlpA family protein disulfide reductase [Actinokineospora iranica]|uniref:Thiol-disulfide isomerase or thioredoxin n=1 Tax=Actinokineospora iranica TaxID=1271860 RepID=A0A1G6Y514_9PSEU|nr:TlpA disulfide reductase family protein [Actinokineospora iranica]SDD85063.1 Thiol-disulfide isomerase or thioredoxin [Actinokineospora iranica]
MTARARWVLVAVVLLVAGVVAVWPRGADPGPVAAPPEPDLTAARVAAALEPCPVGAGGPTALREARAECLADGSRVVVSNVLGGRAVLVNVWATWCPPCRDELPLLAEYAASPDAVDVVGVAIKSPPKDVLDLLHTLDVRFPNLLDRDGSVERGLKVPDALPASYLVAADGTVTFIGQPRVFRGVDDIREAVSRYLGGAR